MSHLIFFSLPSCNWLCYIWSWYLIPNTLPMQHLLRVCHISRMNTLLVLKGFDIWPYNCGHFQLHKQHWLVDWDWRCSSSQRFESWRTVISKFKITKLEWKSYMRSKWRFMFSFKCSYTYDPPFCKTSLSNLELCLHFENITQSHRNMCLFSVHS